MQKFGLGQPVSRLEDPRLITGGGRYTDDINLPGQLRAVVFRSPVAHARIVAVDTEQASQAPGVVAVLTGEDVAASGLGTIQCTFPLSRADGSPMFVPSQPMLAQGRVRFAGEPVAFVVAETHAQAREAAELIGFDFEELEPVISLAAAARKEAPALHEECPDNICFVRQFGDRPATEKALQGAARTVRLDLPVGRVQPAPMEPRGAIGVYDAETGRYTLTLPSQAPHRLRDAASGVLGVGPEALRVISPDVGGGFGNRTGLYRESALVLWAAKMLGRPVKWLADRTESFMCDDQAREQLINVELGLDKDGMFVGLSARMFCAAGAYLSAGTPVPMVGNVPGMMGVYRIPVAHVTVTGLFVNTPSTSAYRGAGRPEATYAIEMAIDRAAREIGIDRFELRRRNMLPPEVLPYANGLGFTYDCGNFLDNQEKALQHADFTGFAARRAESEAKGLLRGFGFANSIESASAAALPEFGRITFDADGVATLRMGTHSHGQGHHTAYMQIMSHFLGLDPDHVVLLQGDTDEADTGTGTFGSRSAAFAGGIIRDTSAAIVEQARETAADMLEAAPHDLEFKEGQFTVVGTNHSISMVEVAKQAVKSGKTLDAKALYRTEAPSFPNGSHACEVEVDPETGTVKLQRYTTVDDFGTIINPLLVDGQVHGGIAQGVGSILLESIIFDESGQLLTGSFMDYAMPRADNLCAMEVISNPVPTPSNALGIKGCGEGGTVGAFPTVMSAILDALSPLGVEAVPMPATPLAVWTAIRQAGGTA